MSPRVGLSAPSLNSEPNVSVQTRDLRVPSQAGRAWPNALLLAAVFVALRSPSLVEPAWYSDEGTYADVGRALLHGAVLYRQVWDNKPPGMYWLAAGEISIAGPGGSTFPAVLALIVAASAVAAWKLGRRCGGTAAATVAALLVIVFMSLPSLQGDVLNAELVGAALVLWAMVLMTGPQRSGWRMVLVGGLLGAAFLMKAVFLLDVAAVLAVPLWMSRARGESLKGARTALPTVGIGLATVLGCAAVALAATRSLGGLINVLLRQDVSYLQLTNGPGGSVLLSTSAASRAGFTALLAVRLVLPLAVAGVVAWRVSRRGNCWAAVLVWWLGCDLAGAMASDRGFPHYIQQAVGPVAIGTALLATAVWRRQGLWRIAAAAILILSWAVLEVTLVLPQLEVSAAVRRPLPKLETDGFQTSQMGEYYRLGWSRLTGGVTQSQYNALFPTDLARQRAVVELFRHNSQPGDRVFVWGTVHWAYALSDRVPAGRYVTLNSAYAIDPHAQSRLVADLTMHPPVVLIADIPLPPPIVDLVHRLNYQLLPGAAAGADVWVAPPTSRSG
jgi:hypothetical protein